MFPIDLDEIVREEVRAWHRPPDGLLHCSSDLVGSLRHAMLTAAGAPRKEATFVRQVATIIGDSLHKSFERWLTKRHIPFMHEVSLTPWLPEGWAGTADYVFWSPEVKAFVLGDLKTQKGESFRWLKDEGGKIEHIWQASAYWYALEQMGLPLVSGIWIYYLPKNEVIGEATEPILFECDVLPKEQLQERMERRWELTKAYLDSIKVMQVDDPRWALLPADIEPGDSITSMPGWYLTNALAPPQERVQKMWWQKKTETWEVKLVPHWSADYCPFAHELCNCSAQGTTKVGHWAIIRDGNGVEEPPFAEYMPRRGYEDIEPEVSPTAKEVRKRCG